MAHIKESVFEPVRSEILLVEDELRAIADVEYPWLAELLDYIVNSGGKRVRPALTLLSGNMCDGCKQEVLIPVAVGVELLHTATLVHDDTIDLSPRRRGKPTAASIWGWGIATLAGDYLFSRAADLVSRANSVRADRLFAQTLMALCTGELEESFSSFSQDQGREEYFRRIGNKTASLFKMATESAGIISAAPENAIQALGDYGYNLGMAFQVVDDILDFTAEEEELGKPVASDLLNGNLTLPGILLVEQYPGDNPVQSIFSTRQKDGNLKRAIEMIRGSDIIPECYDVAQGFVVRACQALEIFRDSDYRQSLLSIADYVLERRK